MTIVKDRRNNLVKFTDLEIGDVFESLTGRILMKIQPTAQTNAVLLSTGFTETFCGDYVYPLTATLQCVPKKEKTK